MRDILTAVAILVLLALTAALVGPHVFDWDSRRAEISRQLSAALGQTVEVEGPIAVSLLPTPTVKLGHVRLGRDGAIAGTIARVRAEAAIPPLLRGQLRITSALVQGARLTVEPSRPSPLALAPAGLEAAVEALQIRDSEFAIAGDSGRPLASFTGVNGVLEATALQGPFRGVVGFTYEGQRRTLRFSTGRAEQKAIRLRAMTENDAAAARAEFDGTLGWGGGALAVDGRALASGNAEISVAGVVRNMLWRGQAQVKGNVELLSADQVELSFGPSDRQVTLAGAADVRLAGAPAVRLSLAARQADIDRLFSGEGEPRAPAPRDLLAALAASGGGAGLQSPWPIVLSAEVTLGRLLTGGGVISAPRVEVSAEPLGAIHVTRAEGEFPGRARLSVGAASEGRTAFSADIRDLSGFATWLQGSPARAMPVRTLSVDGQIVRRTNGVTVENAMIRADEMRFDGSLDADLAGERPLVTARLSADQLDVVKVPDLSAADGTPAFDLDLVLDARRVRYGGVGAGSIRASLSRRGDALRISELTVRELGGASLAASGVVDGTGARLTADVDAQRLEALLELLDRLSAHPVLPLLKARAGQLAPARVSLRSEPVSGDVRRIVLNGNVSSTRIAGEVRVRTDGQLATGDGIDLRIETPALGLMLRKLGLAAIDAPGGGPVRLSIKGAAPAPGRNAPWIAEGTIGQASVRVTGDWKSDASEPFAGEVVIDSPDISPISQTMLVAVPNVQPGSSFRLRSGVDLRGYRITLRDMKAEANGIPVAGEMSFNLAEFGRVAGQLRTTVFDSGLISPLIFGVGPAATAGWNVGAFGSAAAVSLPGDLWIEAGRARLADGLEAEDARFVLRFDNGLLFLEHASARVSGLDVRAQGTLRRSGGAVGLSGRLGFAGGSPFGGAGRGEIEFSGVGDSPAQLVGSLAGGGVITLRGATLPALARGAFTEIAKPGERGETIGRSALVERLRAARTARIPLPDGESRLVLAGGQLRAGPVQLTDGDHDITAQIAYDFRRFSLVGRVAYATRKTPLDWNGPPPQAAFVWTGPIAAPRLEIEADDLANGLTALAIKRETERIEALEQDQRERAFFNRRLRASTEERRALEEQQARQRAERERQDRADRERRERLRAEEAVRRPQPDAAPLDILPSTAR